jgi:hypothetical protein
MPDDLDRMTDLVSSQRIERMTRGFPRCDADLVRL